MTGAGAGVPGTPVLAPPLNATQFRSWENITFTWSAVPGAVSYILQESIDPTFPIGTRARQVDIPGPTETISFNPSIQGSFKARVIAVSASGLMGTPSNLVDFSVADGNPFPAPPTLTAPANGTSRQLPLTLSWTHVANHHDLGQRGHDPDDHGVSGWRDRQLVPHAHPSPAPDSLTLDPVETANGSRGIVRIPLSAMRGHDQTLRLTSSNPAVAAVPPTSSP